MLSIARIPLGLLLEEPGLNLKVHVSADQPGMVRWTATSELSDPTPFLEGGEFLLTTGLATRGWHHEWADYVIRLRQRGVVAIGFGTGLSHPRVPAALVSACRREQLTLVEVPRDVPFVAISQRIAQLLEEHEEATSRAAVVVQHRLTAAATREDLPGLLRILAEAVGGGAQLLTVDALPREPGTTSAMPDPQSVIDLVRRMRPQGLHTSASATGPSGTTVVHPLGSAGRPDGYLVAWSSGPFDDLRRTAVTTAAALVSLVDSTARARRATNQRLVAVALNRLLEADLRAAEVLLEAAAGEPGPAQHLPHRVRALLAAAPRELLDDLQQYVARIGLAAPTKVVAGLLGERLCVLASAREGRTLSGGLAELGARVGVGSLQPLMEARRSLESAAVALDATTPANPLLRWDDLVGRGVLALVGQRTVARFAQSFLDPLTGQPELVETLRSFLAHHGSRAGVADELGIHRNTVRHRLAAIEAGLGRSLDDPAVRVDAWIALQVP